MRTVFTWAVILLALGSVLGCRSPAPQGPDSAGDNEQALKELAEVYSYIAYEKKRPPARAGDLEEYEGSLPVALPKVRASELLIVWGAAHSPTSTAVLAYEKDAPTKGGKVLLRNGSVKQLSAAEVAAGMKAP